MKYEPLPEFDIHKAEIVMERGTLEEKSLLALSAGEFCSNWKMAQNICLKLITHESPKVKANAAMGLAYIARNHRKLDEDSVKPALLKAKEQSSEFRWRIEDAIEDVNLFMEWNFGE